MRALLCGAAIVALTGPAPAAGLKTLYTFTGGVDGGFSFAGLLPGPNGSFFGTTTLNAGSVFQLSPPAQGQSAWTLTTLYTFTDGADGNFPQTLVMDAGGALYGMADHGGTRNGVCASGGTDIGCGTVWRLAPPAQGQTAWQFSVLWSFKGGVDGASPTGGVTFGPSGELYGFTYGGFTCGSGVCGGVFRLTPPGRGMNGWTETTLYSFKGGTDGGLAGSYGPPVLDANGVIYGVTGIGGNVRGPNCKGYGCGTVFSLSPPAGGQTAWTKSALLVFGGRNGIQPIGGLTLDAAGNLFGGTNEGGRLADCVPGKGYPNGCGVAFEVSPAGGGAWQSKVLHRFTNAADGGYPFGAPLHVGGTVYATTSGDEVNSFGSLVALKPAGATRRAQVLFTFTNDADSSSPTGNLVAQGGALFGTTVGAGSGPAPYGTVYSYTP